MALYWRIWAAVTVVMLVVLGVFVALATVRFASINAGLVGERLLVLADRTVAPFASAVRLGLPLSTVRNATALLERARQTDDAILAIHVFDASGRIVHSTSPQPPFAIPPEASRARSVEAGAGWFRETGDEFLGSVDIPGRDGASAGGILIVYPGGDGLTRTRAMLANLSLAAIAVLVAVSTLAALLLRWGLARQIRHFAAIDGEVLAFEQAAWRSAAGGRAPPPPAGATGLHERLELAERKYRAAGRALAARDGSPG
ncbi:hypothetical protein M6I34_13715 [Burkholderiaceae bacterium FT117]|uniref:hypothetical protein n=1 Tax=Zeimonas sediminis TaxID=2944268 RepID=UPI002342BFC4|nr:hypothetical protein [Zeimonas sediminis]MCM5571573.1 hypothetical protein [Zeimonas sediminis]